MAAAKKPCFFSPSMLSIYMYIQISIQNPGLANDYKISVNN